MDPRDKIPENEDAFDQDLVELDIDELPGKGEISQQMENDLHDEDAESEDDAYQESDEALPDDEEEKVLIRNPSLDSGAFDEV